MDRTGYAIECGYPNPAPAVAAKLEQLASISRFGRHQEISSGETSHYWYRVISGAAKRCATQPDGRRQIINLLLPGDFFGIIPSGEREFAVEALVEGTQIARYPRRRAEALADADPAVGRLIREMAFATVVRLETQLLIVGRVTALEKVAAFLLEMGERLAGSPKDSIALPISRCDIAEFLGVSVETVSRSLSGLKHLGLIRFIGTRQVKIVNREAIEYGGFACRSKSCNPALGGPSVKLIDRDQTTT